MDLNGMLDPSMAIAGAMGVMVKEEPDANFVPTNISVRDDEQPQQQAVNGQQIPVQPNADVQITAAVPTKKKRGRPPKNKVKDEPKTQGYGDDQAAPQAPVDVTKVKTEVKQEKITGFVKEKKKRDRFKGMTEEEVLKRVLPDHIREGLDILIIGINPGLTAAFVGHHYAGPGNHFWKCLFLSGLIPEQWNAYDDHKLLDHGIGFTNIVERTSRGSADLSRKEIAAGGEILRTKIAKYQPKIAVFNGKGIYEVFCGKKDFHFGKQPDKFPGTDTIIWVMPSSSARCTQLPRAVDKVPFYQALKKLRDHLRGDLPELKEEECIFDSKLETAPRKEDRIKKEPGEEGAVVKQEPKPEKEKKPRGKPGPKPGSTRKRKSKDGMGDAPPGVQGHQQPGMPNPNMNPGQMQPHPGMPNPNMNPGQGPPHPGMPNPPQQPPMNSGNGQNPAAAQEQPNGNMPTPSSLPSTTASQPSAADMAEINSIFSSPMNLVKQETTPSELAQYGIMPNMPFPQAPYSHSGYNSGQQGQSGPGFSYSPAMDMYPRTTQQAMGMHNPAVTSGMNYMGGQGGWPPHTSHPSMPQHYPPHTSHNGTHHPPAAHQSGQYSQPRPGFQPHPGQSAFTPWFPGGHPDQGYHRQPPAEHYPGPGQPNQHQALPPEETSVKPINIEPQT